MPTAKNEQAKDPNKLVIGQKGEFYTINPTTGEGFQVVCFNLESLLEFLRHYYEQGTTPPPSPANAPTKAPGARSKAHGNQTGPRPPAGYQVRQGKDGLQHIMHNKQDLGGYKTRLQAIKNAKKHKVANG